MNSSIVRRARAGRLFGFIVVLAGFVAVLPFIAQSVLGSVATVAALAEIHGWPAFGRLTGIPTELHAALVVAMVGFAAMMLGARMARRQGTVLESAARHRQDSLRRARHYQDAERIEPFIGPGMPGVALKRSAFDLN